MGDRDRLVPVRRAHHPEEARPHPLGGHPGAATGRLPARVPALTGHQDVAGATVAGLTEAEVATPAHPSIAGQNWALAVGPA